MGEPIRQYLFKILSDFLDSLEKKTKQEIKANDREVRTLQHQGLNL